MLLRLCYANNRILCFKYIFHEGKCKIYSERNETPWNAKLTIVQRTKMVSIQSNTIMTEDEQYKADQKNKFSA